MLARKRQGVALRASTQHEEVDQHKRAHDEGHEQADVAAAPCSHHGVQLPHGRAEQAVRLPRAASLREAGKHGEGIVQVCMAQPDRCNARFRTAWHCGAAVQSRCLACAVQGSGVRDNAQQRQSGSASHPPTHPTQHFRFGVQLVPQGVVVCLQHRRRSLLRRTRVVHPGSGALCRK